MVIDDVGRSVVFGDPLDEVHTVIVNMQCKYRTIFVITNHLPNFRVSMDTMRIFYRLFAFACKECEDGATEFGSLLASNSCVDCIFIEAVEGMMLEVGHG
jgi:hypothetical protein